MSLIIVQNAVFIFFEDVSYSDIKTQIVKDQVQLLRILMVFLYLHCCQLNAFAVMHHENMSVTCIPP